MLSWLPDGTASSTAAGLARGLRGKERVEERNMGNYLAKPALPPTPTSTEVPMQRNADERNEINEAAATWPPVMFTINSAGKSHKVDLQ